MHLMEGATSCMLVKVLDLRLQTPHPPPFDSSAKFAFFVWGGGAQIDKLITTKEPKYN